MGLNGIKKLYILFLIFAVTNTAFAGTTQDWGDGNVYKPNPVLFLHGFAVGNSKDWDYIKSELTKYFEDYATRLTFLETINFNDPNGSIDTYDNGKDGWADTLKKEVDRLSGLYQFKGASLKINLVCHSMGGLVAREYVTNPQYGNSYLNINKIIAIGTPHCGTPAANMKEEAIGGINKIVWEIPYVARSEFYNELQSNDKLVQLFKSELKIDPNGEAVKDMGIRSNFIDTLNARSLASNIKNYVIFGQVTHPWNWAFFRYYYTDNALTSGDLIVPIDSQKGYDIFTDYPNSSKYRWVWKAEKMEGINANHFHELTYKDTPKIILSFLDSTLPELDITSPDPKQITEVKEDFVRVQGRVYKEYLPADSKLRIQIIRESDKKLLLDEERANTIKPSDLWLPNNPDSPVAEFDEKIALSYGPGVYTIKFSVINPAGISSGDKTVIVRTASLSGWIIGPYRPKFTLSFAAWSTEENELILYFTQKPPAIFPLLEVVLENPSSLKVGVPILTDAVAFLVNDETGFIGDEEKPCRVIFSRLELRNLGSVSGSISGQLRADLDGDDEWELHSISGTFENLLVTKL